MIRVQIQEAIQYSTNLITIIVVTARGAAAKAALQTHNKTRMNC